MGGNIIGTDTLVEVSWILPSTYKLSNGLSITSLSQIDVYLAIDNTLINRYSGNITFASNHITITTTFKTSKSGRGTFNLLDTSNNSIIAIEKVEVVPAVAKLIYPGAVNVTT